MAIYSCIRCICLCCLNPLTLNSISKALRAAMILHAFILSLPLILTDQTVSFINFFPCLKFSHLTFLISLFCNASQASP